MAYYKKVQKSVNNLWYPQSYVVGRTNTRALAKHISEGTTLSVTDVMAVLTALPSAMSHYMALGESVKLDNVGIFYYTADASGQGVKTPEEVSVKQINGVHVRFIPAGTRRQNGSYSERPMIAKEITWKEFSEYTSPVSGEDE